MADRLFDVEPLIPQRPIVSRTGKPLSKRTLAQRASERRRLQAMHASHGHGPEGQTCQDCRFLLRREYTRAIMKCQLYGVSCSEATDWRAKWPACGKFEAAK